MVSTMQAQGPTEIAAPPELVGFDHLHWWVGNARQSAHFFATAFGFDVVAYAGPETGVTDRTSYVLRQGDIVFVVTSALDGDSEIAAHVRRHGDGVRDVAYTVTDVEASFDRAVARGARPALAPTVSVDGGGQIARAGVHAYGDTIHTFVSRAGGGAFLPGYQSETWAPVGPPVGLAGWDHVVANVEEGRLDEWVDWYARVFGFGRLQHFGEDAISTEHSALRSTVVWNEGQVVQPINEPAAGLRKSQIAEYLDYYGGPGVQHVALRTDDIVTTVSRLRDRGVRFLRVPDAYYQEAPARLGELGIGLPWDDFADLGILVDRDHAGYLLQVFTENITGRPTVFLEVIQRCGAQGFGEGNFKALFTSIEAEQARRGNL